MNFGDMKTRVSKLILDPNNTVVSAADVGSAINESLSFWKNRRFWFNESVDASVTFTASDPVISDMPTDILYPLKNGGIVIDYQNLRYELFKIRNEEYDSMNSEATGLPRFYVIRDESYEVYPYPDSAYTGIVRYIKDYDDLSASDDTNDFTTNAPNLLIYDASSRCAADYRQDEKMASYFSDRVSMEERNLLMRTNRTNSTGTMAVNC